MKKHNPNQGEFNFNAATPAPALFSFKDDDGHELSVLRRVNADIFIVQYRGEERYMDRETLLDHAGDNRRKIRELIHKMPVT